MPVILKKSSNAYKATTELQHAGSCGLSDIREALCVRFSNPNYFRKHIENENKTKQKPANQQKKILFVQTVA